MFVLQNFPLLYFENLPMISPSLEGFIILFEKLQSCIKFFLVYL